MCGMSYFKINNKNYSLTIGYYDSKIEINGKKYIYPRDKEQISSELNTLSKEQLKEFIMRVLENGEEG